jgi:hypothetical protein
MTKVIKNLSIIAFMLSIFPSVQANSSSSFMRANQLYTFCSSESKVDIAVCEGYIMGVNDSVYSGHLSNLFKMCYPSGVTPSQLRLVVVKHMKIIPEKLHFVADGVVVEALATTFRCKNDK